MILALAQQGSTVGGKGVTVTLDQNVICFVVVGFFTQFVLQFLKSLCFR